MTFPIFLFFFNLNLKIWHIYSDIIHFSVSMVVKIERKIKFVYYFCKLLIVTRWNSRLKSKKGKARSAATLSYQTDKFMYVIERRVLNVLIRPVRRFKVIGGSGEIFFFKYRRVRLYFWNFGGGALKWRCYR